jgi:threonine/homoserine/homoserine lactone efflux protein
VASAFLAGAVAGYAIAIPVGAIAVLIVELGVRRGFRIAAAAGAGAGTADGLYAGLAALGGAALAGVIAPYEEPLRLVAGGVLLGIALRGYAAVLLGRDGAATAAETPRAAIGTYLRFVGLTLLNPMTVIYFAALMLGLPEIGDAPGERAAFVAGAFGSSLSWQVLLAGVGAIAHRRLPTRFRVGVSLIGSTVIAAFALRIGLGG